MKQKETKWIQKAWPTPYNRSIKKEIADKRSYKELLFFLSEKFSAVKDVLTAGLINYKKKQKKFPVGSNGEPAGIVKCIYKFLWSTRCV